jgi:hypothetical protein
MSNYLVVILNEKINTVFYHKKTSLFFLNCGYYVSILP